MIRHTKSAFTTWLQQRNQFWFSVIVGSTAFLLYSCVYSFRKAFSVATFHDIHYLGISYKVWLVTFQVAGYALSKFIGIKVISELKASNRAGGILMMAAVAGLSWLAFAITPAPYNIIFLFTNGLPLGLIWGMIFSYLEGRQSTDALGAGLSVSFIFSSGFSKTVGATLINDWGVSELWMPFATACVFAIPLLIFLWLLDQVPFPSNTDIKLRTRRMPMNALERKSFIRHFLPGILFFVVTYMLLTAFRDFRDNFSAELWHNLGYSKSPEIFTVTEIPISLIVLIIMGCLMMIKNNSTALMINHLIILSGMLLIGLSTILYESGLISPPIWMVLVGIGLYMGYVPFNSTFFDRLLATFKITGTVGFIMYVADSFGYLGSVSVLFYKEFAYSNTTWLNFFIAGGYITSIVGTFLIAGSMTYFYFKYKRTLSQVKDPLNISLV